MYNGVDREKVSASCYNHVTDHTPATPTSHECAVCREGLSQDEIISDKLFDEILGIYIIQLVLSLINYIMCVFVETVVKEKKKEEEELYRIAAANSECVSHVHVYVFGIAIISVVYSELRISY